ncbi:MAG TPA: hypothetical protein VFT72_09715, partial [Opitutaceae bacterium]|nr:hypothetical protein [Opitutaceae bacterium]
MGFLLEPESDVPEDSAAKRGDLERIRLNCSRERHSRAKAQGFCHGEFFSRKKAQDTQRGFLLGRRGSEIPGSGAVWFFGLELQTNTPT